MTEEEQRAALNAERRARRGKAKHAGKIKYWSFANLDQRTIATRRAHDLVNQICEDLGGAAYISTATRQIVQHAAVLGSFIEDLEVRFIMGHIIPVDELLMAINVQRRLFATIGLERRTRDVTPTLQQYLKAHEQAQQQDDDEQDDDDAQEEFAE